MKKLIPNLQQHAVYPVFSNVFKIGVAGRSSTGANLVIIKDIETFEPAVDGNVEEWTPMDTAGWIRRLLTGKSLSITLTGKRNYGDAGNDYVAGLATLLGASCESVLEWTLPTGGVLTMPCTLNVTTFGGGDSTAVDALEVECMSDGQPTFVPTAMALLTFLCEDSVTAGATKISAVSPIKGGLNSYFVKVGGSVPAYGTIITAINGWQAYALAGDIMVANGNQVCLVEVVTATGAAVKGGIATAVVA